MEICYRLFTTRLIRIILYIIICVLFEVSFLTTVRISDSYTIASSIESYLLFTPINTDQQIYYDIFNKEMMLQFIYGNLLQTIYNETNKNYPSQVDKYHYLQYFNYLMGIRITYNRAKLQQTSESKCGTEFTRISDYEGTSVDQYSNVETEDWGTFKIQYSKNGGYNNLGGYVIHIPNDYNIEETLVLYNQLIADGFIDSQFLSAVFEVIFYNENFQTGVVLAYEFIQNNAGELKIDKHRSSFFESQYDKNYHQVTKFVQIMIIISEILYCIGFLWLVYLSWILVYNFISNLIRIRTFTLYVYDYIDLSIVILMIISFGYKYYQVFNQSKISLKSERISLSSLSDYINYAETTETFVLISSITTIFISICFLRILMMQFPSLGALFETIAISFKDFIKLLISLLILMTGFVISASILFGESIYEMRNVQNTFNRLFYYLFGIGSINEYSTNYKILFELFYISFCLIFYFIMIKMLISIVIVRYRYLRSLKQLRNEAMARKVARQTKILKEHIKNLILFRRPNTSVTVR